MLKEGPRAKWIVELFSSGKFVCTLVIPENLLIDWIHNSADLLAEETLPLVRSVSMAQNIPVTQPSANDGADMFAHLAALQVTAVQDSSRYGELVQALRLAKDMTGLASCLHSSYFVKVFLHLHKNKASFLRGMPKAF